MDQQKKSGFQHNSIRSEIETRPSNFSSFARWMALRPIVCLVVLLSFFILLHVILPLSTAIRIGGDEDVALSKAMLYIKGYAFYTQVWDDQPLLHTVLIAQVVKYITPAILGARLLTLAFAILLLTSVFKIVVRISGILVAILATAFLIAAPGFLDLSSSCMVEIPALASALTAVCLLQIERGGKWRLMEILSGILFAISVQTKMNGALYVPLAVIVIWLRSTSQSRSTRQFFYSITIVTFSMILGFAAIQLLIGKGTFSLEVHQSWSSHVAAAKSFEFGSSNDHPFQWSVLLKNWDVALFAVFGVALSMRKLRQTPIFWLPLIWLAITLLVFTIHKPWWNYYYVHNCVPLCWFAALGIVGAWQWVNWPVHKISAILVGVFTICAVLWMATRLSLQITGVRDSAQTYSSLVLKEIEPLKPFSTFLFTDQPIYSFHAGIPLPPKLAVLSLKRLWSGDMTRSRVAEELRRVKPDIMLLSNNADTSAYGNLISESYQLIYEDGEQRLYVSKELAKKANL